MVKHASFHGAGTTEIDGHLAPVSFFLTCDHAEQRSLASLIGPNKDNLLAPMLGRNRRSEKYLVAVLLADGFNADHGRRDLVEARP